MCKQNSVDSVYIIFLHLKNKKLRDSQDVS